jgi:phosphoglycolate phosphatase
MKSDIFNPFNFFSRQWTKTILPWLSLIILAILFIASILEKFIPPIAEYTATPGSRFYWTGFLAFLLITMPLGFHFLSKISTDNKSRGTFVSPSESDSFPNIFNSPASINDELLIWCNSGSTFLPYFMKYSFPPSSFSDVYILIRHPGVEYRIPYDQERINFQRSTIQSDIYQFINIFEKCSTSVQIRGYSEEPSTRMLMRGNNKGFFNLYTTGERQTESGLTCDYAARNKPVIEFDPSDDLGMHILTTLRKRFFDTWSISCPIFPKPTFIFDFDGTLYNSIDANISAWKILLSEYKVEPYSATYNKVLYLVERGLNAPDILSSSFPLTGEHLSTAIKRKRTIYEELLILNNCCLFPEVAEVVFTLKAQGYNLAIATLAGNSLVHRVLSDAGLLKCFSAIICREEVAQGKPSPEVLLKACEHLNINIDQAVFVGDTPADIDAATALNMCFIAIRRHSEDARIRFPLYIKPYQSISNLKELFTIFKFKS